MHENNKNLAVLSVAEQAAYYELPDFDDEQRYEFLTLSSSELELAMSRGNLAAQIYCCLQIAYFKAVNLFFNASWDDVNPKDIEFILDQYFEGDSFYKTKITKHEYYTQCNHIATLYDYKLWASAHIEIIDKQVSKLIQQSTSHQYVALGLLQYLHQEKIVRPKYTTLQTIVITTIQNEKSRISQILADDLSENDCQLILSLLNNEGTFSELAALRQDAKDFKPRMMQQECQKSVTMQPIYQIANRVLPKISLSKANITYYGEMINYYSAHDLRERIKSNQSYLYILCYVWQRFRQVSDNLVDSFCYHQRQAKEQVKVFKGIATAEEAIKQKANINNLKQLVELYVDDNLVDDLQFGTVRKKAFTILDKQSIIDHITKANTSQDDIIHWECVDKVARYLKSNIRILVSHLAFTSNRCNDEVLEAINWLNNLKSKNNIDDYPEIPTRLLPYLTSIKVDSSKKPQLILNRYEYWIYNKLHEEIRQGNIYFEESLQYRSLGDELVTPDKKDTIMEQLSCINGKKPISQQLNELLTESDMLWKKFNKHFIQGKLKHIFYDEKTKTLHLKRSALTKQDKIDHACYEKLPFQDIVNVVKTVDKECMFLEQFTHIQPRYSKLKINFDHLIAVLVAQAMNNGNMKMADIANIPYNNLQDTYASRVRLNTLIAANDVISDSISQMSIFPNYSLDLELLYGAVDGQKFTVATPTIKARYGKKYFGTGKGVVAYSLLCNHVALQTKLLSSNDHESYFAFDIWYNNTSEINPQLLTGDMHILNKANSIIMYWFDSELYPRFTNLENQRKNLYCGQWLDKYEKYVIKPHGVINRKLIEDESDNLQRIIASLGCRDISQSALIKKLCTYTSEHKTREALYELDKLVRSNHILKYLLDPSIITNTHRSQNRLEAYHQLRSAIAQAYGKKQIIGKTDIALEIANQCGRLIANIIIHYNSMILSKLYDKYKAENNQKALKILKKISHVAWQHIHFQGHLVFAKNPIIDLDDIVKSLELV